jgi:hypothetical protein
MKNIGFYLARFSERGTETAIYDYAHYNETILKNKSYIICFKHLYESANAVFRQDSQNPFLKFNKRFPILIIETLYDIPKIIEKYSLNIFYDLVNERTTGMQFENTSIWGKCKTVKHCVFDTTFPEGDVHISISNWLNVANKTALQIVPHMIDIHPTTANFRTEFNIPDSAIVFGRYGGCDTFNIQYAMNAITEVATAHRDKYFLFMNTFPFCHLPNVIFLGLSVDMEYKRKFINTCDAFVHARSEGETFGLSIGEFAICMKPILTCSEGKDTAHLEILKEKAICYSSKEELVDILSSFSRDKYEMTGNGYLAYTPVHVMEIFDKIIIENGNE